MTCDGKPVPVKFPALHKTSFEPRQEVIDKVEGLLRLAKSGKLQSFMVAVVCHDDLNIDGDIGYDWSVMPGTNYAMGSALLRMTHKYGAILKHAGIDLAREGL